MNEEAVREYSVTLHVGGFERKFTGTYDELHNKHWDAVVQAMLDDAEEHEKSITSESVLDGPLGKFLK